MQFLQVPNTPMQSVLEAKYLHNQEVYRFEVDHEPEAADTHTFLINFTRLTMRDIAGRIWKLRHRPLLLTEQEMVAGKV